MISVTKTEHSVSPGGQEKLPGGQTFCQLWVSKDSNASGLVGETFKNREQSEPWDPEAAFGAWGGQRVGTTGTQSASV